MAAAELGETQQALEIARRPLQGGFRHLKRLGRLAEAAFAPDGDQRADFVFAQLPGQHLRLFRARIEPADRRHIVENLAKEAGRSNMEELAVRGQETAGGASVE